MDTKKEPKIIKTDEMDKKFQDALNEALTLFEVEEIIQVGILELEGNTRLPSEGMSEHEDSQEFSYVIEGEVIIGTESGEKKVKEGELMYNQPGTKHYTRNGKSKPAKVLWFLAPPM